MPERKPVRENDSSDAGKMSEQETVWREFAGILLKGATQGKIIREQTSRTKIKGHKIAASKNDPQYIVESDKSGKRAAHKPQELRRKG